MSTMSRVRQLLARRDGIAQLAVVLGAVAAYEVSRLAMDPNWTQAFTNAPIYARTSGYLKRWYFDIGAHVKKGQLLAEIDARTSATAVVRTASCARDMRRRASDSSRREPLSAASSRCRSI